MKKQKTTRLLGDVNNGEYMRKAKENRKRLENPTDEETQWWHWYERAIASTPVGQPLPLDVPQGQLPKVGKVPRGMHIIEEEYEEEEGA